MFRKRPRDNDNSEKSPADVPARREDVTPRAPKASLEASLEIVGGPNKGETRRLERMVTLIGRGEGCDIVLDDETVSREHGQIEQAVGQWIYTNFSENATWVNRKQVERVALGDGDTIEVGSKTRMRFRLTEPKKVQAVAPVRRRVRRTREEIEAELEDVVEEGTPSLGGELAKRRKTLMMVGAYFVAMLALFAGLFIASMGNDKQRNTGWQIYEKDRLARWLNELDFGMPPDNAMYNRQIKIAESLYDGYQFGGKMDLYRAIEAFQKAVECNDRRSFRQIKHFTMFRDAKKRLVELLWDDYMAAIRAQDSRKDYKEARELYRKILQRIPSDADFCSHVRDRMTRPRTR
jgi:pSer/pThr/pTyr-binding forkhead associated (FHA) protein